MRQQHWCGRLFEKFSLAKGYDRVEEVPDIYGFPSADTKSKAQL